MRTRMLWIAALVALALPAASATAAQHGGGGHGGGGWHGGGHVVVGGYWGPAWGWGWGYLVYYGYYGYPYEGGGYRYVANSWGAVKTDVEPDEARLYLDGQYIGTADDFDGWPDKLYLRPGHYTLEFRLHGYETLTIPVNAQAGATLEVDNRMQKIHGQVNQPADPPKMEGDVPRFFGKKHERDRARAYRGDPEDPDWSDRRGEADMDDDQPADVRPAPAPRPRGDDSWRRPNADSTVTAHPARSDRGRLTIHAEPADAAVYVDDRFVGTADELGSMERGIVIPPGKHTITVSRPGYKDRSTEVEVAAGHSETVRLTLEK